MLNSKKTQGILYSLLLFISIVGAPASRAFAEARIKIPQHVIDKLEESARQDEEEAKRLLKEKEEIEEELLKIIEEAKRKSAEAKKNSRNKRTQ